MQNKLANARYRIIDKCLRDKRKQFPTLDDLVDACSDGLSNMGKKENVGRSTIQHDLQDLREGRAILGVRAPIAYSKGEKGYYYEDRNFSLDTLQLDDLEVDALRQAASLLSQYKNIPMFTHFKSAIERIDATFDLGLNPDDVDEKIIQLEKGHSTAGYEWIAPIYHAIKDNYLLEFRYENIYKKEKRFYRAVPYMLKENRNHWYLDVWSEDKNEYVTFALDRIIELKVVIERQVKRTDYDPHKQAASSIGIFTVNGKPPLIKLVIQTPHDRLVTLEPLHSSQKITKTGPNGIKLQLQVHITPELISRILSFGSTCIVESPQSLKDQIKSTITAMKKLYS